MDIIAGEIFPLVFKPVLKENAGEFSLDSHMLSVLVQLDGKKNIGSVAKKMGLNMNTMRGVVSKLLDLGLIEPVENGVSLLDKDFFQYMTKRLSFAIGPLAEILIEDAVSDLGHSMSRFPSHKAAELVDLIAREIQREEKMTRFKQEMLGKIKEKGY